MVFMSPSGPQTEGVGVSTKQLAFSGMALIAVCYGLARFAYGLFVPEFRAAFGLDGEILGLIGGSSYVAYCLGIVMSFVLTDRLGPRIVAISAGIIATLGISLIAVSPNAVVLGAGVLLAGSSTGIASPPLAAAVARWVADYRRDRVQTVVNAGTGIGVLLSGPVALGVADHWRWAWAGFAILAAVVSIWVSRSLPGCAYDRDIARVRSVCPAGWVRGAGGMSLAATVMGGASAAVWVFGRDVVVTAGAINPAITNWLWVTLGVAGVTGALAGDIVNHIGLRSAWMAAMLGMGISTATLGVFPGAWILALGASAAFGALYILLTGVLLVWGTRVYPHRPAVGVGLAFLMIAVGQSIGAPVVGIILAQGTALMAFLVFAAVAALGSLLSLRLHF